MDKSRSAIKNDTEDTVKTLNKSRSISSVSFSDKSTNIEQPKRIDVRSDIPGLSGISGPGASVTGEFPDKQLIHHNNLINNTSKASIKGTETIQEPDNPSKRGKEDSIIDEKNIIKKTPPPFVKK